MGYMSIMDGIRGSSTATVTPLIGRDFFINTVGLIGKAEKSIDFTCFQSSKQAIKSTSKTGKLFQKIGEAASRGVRVRVIFHMPGRIPAISRGNTAASLLLQESGVQIRYGRPDDTLHSKIFLIDNRITLIGSHNLTDRGLWDNYEASMGVDNFQLTASYAAFFDFLWDRSREV